MRLLHESILYVRSPSQAGRKRVYNSKDGELCIGDLWLIAGSVLASSRTIETVLLDGRAAVIILLNCTRFKFHFQEWLDPLKQTSPTYHIAADVNTHNYVGLMSANCSGMQEDHETLSMTYTSMSDEAFAYVHMDKLSSNDARCS